MFPFRPSAHPEQPSDHIIASLVSNSWHAPSPDLLTPRSISFATRTI